jgi:hypothetical protein
VFGGSCSGSHAGYIPVDNGTQVISVGASNLQFSDGSSYPSDVEYAAGMNDSPVQLLPPSVPGANYSWGLT